ncbi:MAG: peptide-methionine (R)-S-oxide reductase MsrB [Oligoflexia bacterium]|nr:peptide-methionine (R)-S-oxide reductase MsrB [Oligoflexia bacterium]
MKKLLTITLLLGFTMFGFLKTAAGDEKVGHTSPHLKELDPDKVNWKEKDDKYWKSVLTPMQYKVTRHEGTERAFTGQFWDHKEKGIYTCSNCGHELFHSDTKFKSGTGWPSYYQPIRSENVGEKKDSSFGMTRTEVHCSRCGAHLGHVFPDGPQPTGLRYCINSVSLNFKKEK